MTDIRVAAPEGPPLNETVTVCAADSTGYAFAFDVYWPLGWHGVLPLNPGFKAGPGSGLPTGYTGHNGMMPSYADIMQWAESRPRGSNLCLRMPNDDQIAVAGIDVDAYRDKVGARTFAEAERRWGALPDSPRSTSRPDDPVSGIRFYRIPPGTLLETRIKFDGASDIEIIQRHHRYAVVWPSIHPEGRQYQWVDDQGNPTDPPKLDDLPWLPQKWVDELKAKPKAELGSEAPYNVRQALTTGEMSPRVRYHLTEALTRCHHDSTRDDVLLMLRYGKWGDSGVEPALRALKAQFIAEAGPRRPGRSLEAEHEFHAFVEGDRVPELLAWSNLDWFERLCRKAREQAEAAPIAPTVDDLGRPFYAPRLLTVSDLRALPDPEPLIDDVLDQGTTALLYGKWGTAKTFIALDWAACVATGRPWQGRPTAQRRVLYVVAEGAFGFKGRTAAWQTGWRTTIGDEWLSILPTPVNLMNPTDRSNLYSVVNWGGYGFVVIDTMARCMVGGDENSAKDCGVVVEALTYVLANTPGGRGVVLGVHHAGKDGKTLRGSSAFESGADTVYFTSKDDAVIGLTRQKRKDGPEHDHHVLRLDPIPGTDSCTLKASHGETTGETTAKTAALRLILSQHFVSTGATAAELRRVAVDEGTMSRASFYRAVNDLVESGYVINTGTDKRPFYKVNQ